MSGGANGMIPSVVQIPPEMLTKFEFCKCNRGERVKNFCPSKDCPEYSTLYQYCEICEDELKVHKDHRPKRIYSTILIESTLWR